MMWRQLHLLWLLLPVAATALLLAWAQRRRTAELAQFADTALAQRLAGDRAPARRVFRQGLRVALLALMVLALAGPKYGFRWEQVQRQGIDLLVAVDTSRSMLATDVVPNRLERAKLAVLDLLPRLRGDRIGLVAFAGAAFLETPLTLDYGAFARSLRALHVGIIPRGGTSLSRAIETSLDAFEARQGKYEALIIITDGEENEGEAMVAAGTAAERGVRIFTVGIGTPEGELLPLPDGGAGFVKDRKGQVVKSRLNESLLREIALKTGGAYVRGLGPQLGLDQVFDEHIARMERRDVESGLERRYEERFQLPLLVALLLIWVEALVGDRARRPLRVPQWMRRRRNVAVAGCVAALWLAVSDPALGAPFAAAEDPINRGVDLYAGGDFEAAVAAFGEALVESPASPLLQFNLAAALHRQGRHEEAASTLEKVVAEGGAEWAARASYNLGNAYFELGAAAEQEQPQQALERWSQALMAYRRTLGADPQHEDARYNHELTQRRIAALQERLEREREEQEPPPDDDGEPQEQPDGGDPEQQPEQGEDTPEPSEQGDGEDRQPESEHGERESPDPSQSDAEESEQPPGEGEESPEQREAGEQDSPADDRSDDTGEAPPADAGVGDADSADEEQNMQEQAARAVLDVARDEELGPEDIRRDLGVVGIGDPLRDW